MIVSLATIPPRSKNLDIVIKNILNQNIKPSKIILNICDNYKRFSKQKIELSDYVKNNVEIKVWPDHGPIIKAYGSIGEVGPITIVDDDSLMPDNALSLYEEHYNEDNTKAYCFRGRNITSSKYNLFKLLSYGNFSTCQNAACIVLTYSISSGYSYGNIFSLLSKIDIYCISISKVKNTILYY